MSGTLISSEIGEPYAQALMSLAKQNNLTEQFGQTFRSLSSLLAESKEFKEFVLNPVVKGEDKKAVLKKVMGDDANPYLVNFMMLLVDKRRIIFLEPIVEQYLNLLRKLNQTVLAEVTSATELSEAQQANIVEKVKAIAEARDVELKTTVDPDLIGGVIIKVGSKVIDASLRGQLRRISISRNQKRRATPRRTGRINFGADLQRQPLRKTQTSDSSFRNKFGSRGLGNALVNVNKE